MNRRNPHPLLALLLTLAALAGCASLDPGGAPGPAAGAAEYRVGDRWVYRAQDGFRSPVVWEESHEVTAVGPAGITVRVIARGPAVEVDRIEQWAAPGVVRSGAVFDLETRRFEPPLLRYRFPLAAGDRWSQRIANPDQPPGPYGPLDRYTRVGGYEAVTTPAGTFDAIRLRVIMRLDDETFWRHATECTYLVWYAPAIGAAVRENRNADYLEKGGGRLEPAFRWPSQHAQLELVSYQRGR